MEEFEEKKELITETLTEMRNKTLDKDELDQTTQDSFSLRESFIIERDSIPNSREKIKQILNVLDDKRINEIVQKSALLAVLYDLDIEYKFSFSNTYRTLHIKIRSRIQEDFLTKVQRRDFKKYGNIPEKRSGNLGIAKGFLIFKNGETKQIDARENMAFSIFNNVCVNEQGTLYEDNNGTSQQEIINKNTDFISSPEKLESWKYKETVRECGPVGNTYSNGSENERNRTWRFNDSECKLIEKITSTIDEFLREGNSNELTNGKIEIFTERPPCRSCKAVMKKFTDDYSSITINVIDGHGNKLTIEKGIIQEK